MTPSFSRHGSVGFNGEEGVTIIAIGVGPQVRRENLEQLASFPTNATVIIERDVNRISTEELRTKLVDLICNSQYFDVFKNTRSSHP